MSVRKHGARQGETVKYRGVEYHVVQTIDGKFRWSVQFGQQEKSGIDMRRESAVVRAKTRIDDRARKLKQPQNQTPAFGLPRNLV
jgi:hypothetical protein